MQTATNKLIGGNGAEFIITMQKVNNTHVLL